MFFFVRKSLIFEQHVSINKVLNELSMGRSNLVTLLHHINIKIHTLYGSSHDGKFISKTITTTYRSIEKELLVEGMAVTPSAMTNILSIGKNIIQRSK